MSAKSTFGTLKPLTYSSDYIYSKKAKLFANNERKNCSCKKILNQRDLLLFYHGSRYKILDRSNLVAGLYTKEDLSSVVCLCTVDSNHSCTNTTSVNICKVPFYAYYTIDPNGSLFGNTECGLHNYTRYMVLTPR
jgi:hypothetical protein